MSAGFSGKYIRCFIARSKWQKCCALDWMKVRSEQLIQERMIVNERLWKYFTQFFIPKITLKIWKLIIVGDVQIRLENIYWHFFIKFQSCVNNIQSPKLNKRDLFPLFVVSKECICQVRNINGSLTQLYTDRTDKYSRCITIFENRKLGNAHCTLTTQWKVKINATANTVSNISWWFIRGFTCAILMSR